MSETTANPTAFDFRERQVFDREAILSTLNVTPLRREDFIIVGGANLVLREVREKTGDIDLLVNHSGFMRLVHTLGSKLKDPPLMALRNGAVKRAIMLEQPALVPVSATEEMGDVYPMDFQTASEGAVKIDRFTCQAIDQIIQSKRAIARPVDIEDLRLLSKHMQVALDIPRLPGRIPEDS